MFVIVYKYLLKTYWTDFRISLIESYIINQREFGYIKLYFINKIRNPYNICINLTWGLRAEIKHFFHG